MMFGHQDHDQDNSQADNMAVPPAEPVDDGSLGVPTPDNDGVLSAPTVGSSDAGMPQDGGASLPTIAPPSAPVAASVSTGDDLISIKQEALHQLKPLVGHLDQTPEEKFRTTMMMIQASDDQSLIGEAYEAAKGISDEKVRAQALLDVVNEINYFTSQKNPS
jgi:hypothetical protein